MRRVADVFSNIFLKKENISSGIFFLFIGFVIGNLFGTFLPAIRIFFSWDGFIVLFLLFFIEFISYIRYHMPSRFFLILWNFREIPKRFTDPFVDETISGINFRRRPKSVRLLRRRLLRPLRPRPNKKVFLEGLLRSNQTMPTSSKIQARTDGGRKDEKLSQLSWFPVEKTKKAKQNQTAGNFPFLNFSASTAPAFVEVPGASTLRCSLNYFKIGFLLGFFIDAYKVGS